MRALDGFSLSNANASSALKELSGGLYGMDAVATWGGGNVDLQKLAADGSTLIDVSSATKMMANGYATAYLSPGFYQLTVTTSTAVYARISRIPGE